MEGFVNTKDRIKEITDTLYAFGLRIRELEERGENVISDDEHLELSDLINKRIILIRERNRLYDLVK